MDRRSFFRTMVGGVALATAERYFPFRVFSFPSTVELHPYLTKEALRRMVEEWKSKSIMPFAGGKFYGYVHPLVLRDVLDKRFRHVDLYRYDLRAA